MMDIENVSRETLRDFKLYESLLAKWNTKINLVSASTISSAFNRHFLDSLQLMDHVECCDGAWYDLGSGGGFPGLVCAIAAKDIAPNLRFHLVESDNRKAAFLNAVLREVNANAIVSAQRIEALPASEATYISARALSSINKLLEFGEQLIGPATTCLFLKGARLQEELSSARINWNFTETTIPSKTDPTGSVLVLKDVQRV